MDFNRSPSATQNISKWKNEIVYVNLHFNNQVVTFPLLMAPVLMKIGTNINTSTNQ